MPEQLFPTWVGVIPTMVLLIGAPPTFPHMGGGDPVAANLKPEGKNFSPHGWG